MDSPKDLPHPVHPGVWINEQVVLRHNINPSDLARHLGLSRPALMALLEGRADISAKLAIGFEKAFGLNADWLCEMQKDFELAGARVLQDAIKVKPFSLP